jgi:hypothetical protein
MIPDNGHWEGAGSIAAQSYICGHTNCGLNVSSERGWRYLVGQARVATLLICPNCRLPTLLDRTTGAQIPGVVLGGAVQKLPEGIATLWAEIRKCTGVGAYTAAVLAGRTLLMHIAVSQGAATGQTFLGYVDYLVDNHFAPPNSKVWVDRIRAHGNEATHEIVLKTEADAKEIMVFLEMLLKFIYEFPNLA